MSNLITQKPLFGPLHFYKKCLLIALPVMLQQLLQSLVSLIDNFMVAGLGDIKMSGVNVAGQINFIFLVLMGTVFMSSGIFMSQFNGAKDKNGMQQTFRFKLIITLFIGIVFSFLSFYCPKQMMSIMVHGNHDKNAILAQGELYMKVLAFSWIPTVISGSISSSMREIGLVKPPLVISVSAGLVNTFFNYLFIYGNLGATRMEVQGAAVSTIIARMLEMIAFLIYMAKKQPAFTTRILDILKVKIALVKNIFSKSFGILITEMTWVFSETITTALYNSRGGSEIVSGMAAGFNIANLFFIAIGGIFTSTGVIVGGTLGANRLDEARDQARWILSGSPFFGIGGSLIGLASLLLIPVVFANLSADARSVTFGLLLVCIAYMPMWCYINAQYAIARTGGDSMMGVVIDVTVNVLLFVPLMVVLTKYTLLSPVIMYGLVKLTDFAKVSGAFWWLKKEKWLKNLTN
ncbi:MAG: MATE family efflux transporter [Treponemataceae bacterium]